MVRLGRLIRVKRQELGLRQDQLAAAAGVKRNAITQLELGNTRYPKHLPEILKALDLDITDLLVDAPIAPPPGSAPPLAHLSDAQVGSEAMRLLAEMAARLASRPVATAVPTPGTYGVLSAVDGATEDNGAAR